MLLRSPANRRPAGRILLPVLGLLVLGLAGPAQAITLVADLAPASTLSQGGPPAALTGSVTVEVGELPPPTANTPLDVVALAASGAGLSITLDDGLANPGLGVLFTDGTFVIPSLHLSVDGTDLTVTNVSGTFGTSAACGGFLCLETSFQVDPGAGGIVTIDVAALVPEPSVLALAFPAAGFFFVVGASRRGRA